MTLILSIPVSIAPAAPVTTRIEPSVLMRRLLAKGYRQIDLTGLAPLGNRLRDGQVWDAMPLQVEEDAEFLAQAFLDLRLALTEERPAKHWVYLSDGCFEITGVLTGQFAQVRIGEYRTPLEEEPGVTLLEGEYINLWRSVVSGLLSGLDDPTAM